MLRLTCIAATVFLSACVTSRPVSLPSGATGYEIECPGSLRNWSSCMNKAASLCGGPYEILTQDGTSQPVMVNSVGTSATIVNAENRTLIVACKSGAEDELRAFSADPRHRHFEAVRHDMIRLIESGQADSFEQAYAIAVQARGLD